MRRHENQSKNLIIVSNHNYSLIRMASVHENAIFTTLTTFSAAVRVGGKRRPSKKSFSSK